MTTFTEKDYNTFWGQYADIEQSHQTRVKNIEQIIRRDMTPILDPIKEENEENEDIEENEQKEENEDIKYCNYNKILYYQLCVIVFTIFTIFMV